MKYCIFSLLLLSTQPCYSHDVYHSCDPSNKDYLDCGESGECRIYDNEAHCYCPGKNIISHWPCQPKKHSCQTITCRNGGTCTNKPGSFRGFQCDCLPGYRGPKCGIIFVQATVADCSKPRCLNGGTCIETIRPGSRMNHTCKCTDEYRGRFCQKQNPTCSDLDCYPGVCEVKHKRHAIAYCKCPNGSTDENHCHEEVAGEGDMTACDGDAICNNHGECSQDRNNPAQTHCHCDPGFSGDHCEHAD